MKKTILLGLAILFSICSFAQKDVYLNIAHKLGSANFAFNQQAQNSLNQSFVINRMEYYISSIKIIHDGGLETTVPNKYILADGASNVNELLGNFSVTNVEGIKFSIGVEAPANNGDPSLYPPAHPLAPKSPSMHWGWSAGYRFVALEGLAGSSLNTTFQMHGLWNANYYEQTQMASGVSSGNDIYINLDADYIEALSGINIQAGPIDHGTNGTDLDVLRNFRDYVFTPSSGSTGVPDISDIANIQLYPNPFISTFYIDNTDANMDVDNIIVYDALGRTIIEKDLDRNLNSLQLDAKGTYMVVFKKKDEILGRKIVLAQ